MASEASNDLSPLRNFVSTKSSPTVCTKRSGTKKRSCDKYEMPLDSRTRISAAISARHHLGNASLYPSIWTIGATMGTSMRGASAAISATMSTSTFSADASNASSSVGCGAANSSPSSIL